MAVDLTRPLADRMRPRSLEEFVGQVKTYANHGGGLHGLGGRTRHDAPIGIAPRLQNGTRGIDDDGMTAMLALDEAAAAVGCQHSGRRRRHPGMMPR